MKQKVGVLGFEPGLQRTLEFLLQREAGLMLVPVSLNESQSPEPDTLLVFPPNAKWVEQVRERFPGVRLLAMVDWHRRPLFRDSPIDGYVETLLSYSDLLHQVRGHA